MRTLVLSGSRRRTSRSTPRGRYNPALQADAPLHCFARHYRRIYLVSVTGRVTWLSATMSFCGSQHFAMDVIETERLVLRRQVVDDAPFIFRLMNDPAWLQHIGDRGVRTTDEARAYIQDGAVAMYERHGFGLFLVETKGDRTPVGICGVIRRDSLPDVDLGFALVPEHRGVGYAREAAAATVAYARSELGLDGLVAIVSPGNAASIRLLEALGFTWDREFDHPGGELVHLYALAFQGASA